MNGIIVVDKPEGFTSFDVVAKMRGILATKKIGHSGTLDPMATGVLPVFVGRAVKAVDLQPRQDKEYRATLLFGLQTDTGDITGLPLEQRDVQIGEAAVREALPRFLGELQQTPPMYSAVKVKGKPLYSYAREGRQVERKSRTVEVLDIEYLGGAGDNRHQIRVHCSKGTYIRTLAEQIGEALGAPATLAALRRTAAGVFGEGDALPLEAIQQAKDEGRVAGLLRSPEALFAALPAVELGQEETARLLNGGVLRKGTLAPGRYRATDGAGFLGLAEVDAEGTLRAVKILDERG